MPFYNKAVPRAPLPQGVFVGSVKEFAETNPGVAEKYYAAIADTKKGCRNGFEHYVCAGLPCGLCSERNKSGTYNTSCKYSPLRCRFNG